MGGPSRDGTRRVTLVGRGRELNAVRAALRDRRPVVVTGATGTGRTALARAALHTRATAWGGGLATLAGRPYAAFEWALAAEVPRGVAVGSGAPGDGGVPGARGGGSPGGGGVGQAGEVGAWVSGRLAGRTLVLDDLHLAHPATVAVAARLAGVVPLVATLATDQPGAAGLHEEVRRWRRVAIVELAALDAEAAVRLVRRTAPELGAGEAARVAAGAGGSPGDLVKAAAAAATELAERPGHARPATRARAAALTVREAQVLRLIAAGAKSAQIAARLGIADSTVESHVRAIRTKLGVPTRTAAAAWVG